MENEAKSTAYDRIKHDVLNGRFLPEVESDIREVMALADIGIEWTKDSSLERWFPFSAKELEEYRAGKRPNVES